MTYLICKRYLVCLIVLFVVVTSSYASQQPGTELSKEDEVDSALDNWEAVLGRARKVSREKSWKGMYEKLKKASFKQEEEELPFVTKNFARENIDSVKTKKHEFKLSTEIYYHKSEDFNDSNFKTKSIVYSINPAYSYRPNKGDYLYLPFLNYYSLDGRFASGKIKIEREDDDSTGIFTNDADNDEFEIRGLLGKEYLKDDFSFILFSGLGYRQADYKADVNYMFNHKMKRYYLPLGLNYQRPIHEKWNVSFTGEYDIVISGSYKLSPGSIPQLDQNSGYGLRGSVMLVRETKNFDLFFGPTIRYWDMDGTEESEELKIDEDTYIGVGRTKTYNYGLNMGVKF